MAGRHVLSNGTLVFPPYAADFYRKEVHSAEYRCLATSPFGSFLSPAITVQSGQLTRAKLIIWNY